MDFAAAQRDGRATDRRQGELRSLCRQDSQGKRMLRTIKLVVQVAWAGCMLVLGTAIGASYGFARHGLGGAVALGFVGLCLGALVAAWPEMALEILFSGIW
jgi:CHASE2 domain-containing sensor protein